MFISHTFRALLITSTLGLSWLAMMAVHELGHVLDAWLSGGRVVRVALHPLVISRTDVSPNPHPRLVAWGGPLWGTLIPLFIWGAMYAGRCRYAFLAAFFAGFCCLANGLYLAAGSLGRVGDAGDLLHHGAAAWQLWLFGVPTSLLGLWLWNGLGPHFGLGVPETHVDRRVAIALAFLLTTVFLVEWGLFARQ